MTEKKEAKLVSFVAVKGGVGKTTIAFNTASYLASKGNKVLAIDLDFQANMSSDFCLSKEDLAKCNVSTIFEDTLKHQETEIRPMPIDETGNLYGLSSDDGLMDIDSLFSNMNNAWSIMTRYLINNINASEKFDYIIFDTHPNLALATQNGLINSDYMIVPFGPNRYSVQSLDKMVDNYKRLQRSFTDPMGNTYLNAKMLYIGNLVDFNTAQSHKFKEAMKGVKQYVGYFYRRQAFVKAEVARKPVLKYLEETGENDKAALEIRNTLDNLYQALKED